ncbi:hypothetical protein RB195_016940 [Necator americanus]|uniref:Uncharacterized protein n=1 Tax=Necator americanus TaxID=51031 RepID=A0ABR1C2V5_NECAM
MSTSPLGLQCLRGALTGRQMRADFADLRAQRIKQLMVLVTRLRTLIIRTLLPEDSGHIVLGSGAAAREVFANIRSQQDMHYELHSTYARFVVVSPLTRTRRRDVNIVIYLRNPLRVEKTEKC